MVERHNPEKSLAELRLARDHGSAENREIARIMTDAADRAADELWPNPRDRELAGIGAVVTGATLAVLAETGLDAGLLNAVGFFGLGLVENARAEAARG